MLKPPSKTSIRPENKTSNSNGLDVKKAILGPPPKYTQGDLFHVEKQVKFDGIEMGVLENGVPYLSESGLARM